MAMLSSVKVADIAFTSSLYRRISALPSSKSMFALRRVAGSTFLSWWEHRFGISRRSQKPTPYIGLIAYERRLMPSVACGFWQARILERYWRRAFFVLG